MTQSPARGEASVPAAGIGDPVVLHVAASRIRSAVAVGGFLPLDELRGLHPALAGVDARSGGLASASALCGMRPVPEGDGVRFVDPSAPASPAADAPDPRAPSWDPPAPLPTTRRAFALADASVASTGAERSVAALAAALGGTVRASDLRDAPSTGHLGAADRLRAFNALVAKGGLRSASPDGAAAAAWRARCGEMLELVSRSGRVHAPFAALRLGLGSAADANLVGAYLCDLGLLRKEKGAYLPA